MIIFSKIVKSNDAMTLDTSVKDEQPIEGDILIAIVRQNKDIDNPICPAGFTLEASHIEKEHKFIMYSKVLSDSEKLTYTWQTFGYTEIGIALHRAIR